MNEPLTLDLIISIILFWSIALIPPLVTRFLILKKPMRKYSAYIFVVFFWFVNFTAQYLGGALRQEIVGGGPPKPGMIGLFLMCLATYAILMHSKDKKDKKKVNATEGNNNIDPKDKWNPPGADKW